MRRQRPAIVAHAYAPICAAFADYGVYQIGDV
jgi:hypothetical protein